VIGSGGWVDSGRCPKGGMFRDPSREMPTMATILSGRPEYVTRQAALPGWEIYATTHQVT